MIITNLIFISTGPNGSVDEQIISFQGRYADKEKTKFKREGDGFIADYWHNNSFTYSFYFRNMPPPQKYLHLKLSTLHSRVLGLFDTLLNKSCKCWVNNLYTLVNFLIHVLKHKAHVMIEEVCCSSYRGFPKVVKQEEVRGDENLCRVVGTVKAAELVVAGLDDKIVATSIYDLKPVYFLSSSCEEIS